MYLKLKNVYDAFCIKYKYLKKQTLQIFKMRKIEAIIRETSFKDVKVALENIGVQQYSYWEVKSHGKEKSEVKTYRGVTISSGDLKRIKLSIVINDTGQEIVIKEIIKAAQTGFTGDGKLFVVDVHEVYSIRTGLRGRDVLKLFAEVVTQKVTNQTDKVKSFYEKFK